jgi:extracellular elastinolytic metalloproteinase
MTREIDLRVQGGYFEEDKREPRRQAELENVATQISQNLPGEHRIRIESFDAVTGNPAAIASESAPAEAGNYVQRALDYVQRISPALGLVATQPKEFKTSPYAQETSSGARAVHLKQTYKGIGIFQAAQTVRFAPDDRITEAVGSSVTIAQDVPVSPRLTVEQAVLKAAQFVATPGTEETAARDQFGQPLAPPVSVDVTGFVPKVIATFTDISEQPTVLEGGPFGNPIRAKLIWFPLEDNELRLAWEVVVTMPANRGQYRTMVDAERGEILYNHQLVQHIAAQGNVYRIDGSRPREMTPFPRPLEDYGLPIPNDLPNGFPDPWVERDEAVGNSVEAHLDFDQADPGRGPTIQGEVKDGVLTFDPADPNGDEQKVLNIFYLNCYMHDYFYLLGFREADGNFQIDNLGRGGVPADRVDARSFPMPIDGTATMASAADGKTPLMSMGLVEVEGDPPERHTAFDFQVICHEFTHGVSNRLVGGPDDDQSLEADQSDGMNEGLSDYYACSITDDTVIGAWVVDRPGGIREFAYDSEFPDGFGDLGTGRYRNINPRDPTRKWPHPIGEIWCATLMEMNRNIGVTLGVQLVLDALKLSPANPSFLQMRDSILAALDAMLTSGTVSPDEHSAARNGIWAAFAKFGMGPRARSNGASLSGIVPDHSTP